MVRKVANRGLTTHPNHVNPLCFQLISCGITVTCNRFVGFLSSWLFLIIWSKNVFGRQQRFFTATTKISAVSGKNQKKEHQEGIGIYICIYLYVCIIIIIIIITIIIIIIIIMNYREGGVSSGFCCPTFLCFFWVGLLLSFVRCFVLPCCLPGFPFKDEEEALKVE